jgi:hypothetical protein
MQVLPSMCKACTDTDSVSIQRITAQKKIKKQ